MVCTDFKPIHEKTTSRTKKKKPLINLKIKTKKRRKGKIMLGTKAHRRLQYAKSSKVEWLFLNVQVALRLFSITVVVNCNRGKIVFHSMAGENIFKINLTPG